VWNLLSTPAGGVKMKSFLTLNLSAAFFLLCSSFAFAVSFDLAGPSAPNVDNATATIVSFTSSATGAITDLNLAVGFSGGFARDLDIFLRHGDVTVHVLEGIADASNYSGTTFDDEATVAPPATLKDGPYLPLEALSIFDGSTLEGLWELILIDNTGYHDDGTDLDSWRIFGEATSASPGPDPAPVPEPSTMLLLGAGLAGLAWRGGKR
jgi:hypothetical protein